MFLTYVLGSLALIVKPGPDLMCTVATAIAYGRRSALALMAGLIAGCWLWVVMLAAGVAAFFSAHKAVLAAIQCVGAAYIAWLAYATFREARTAGAPDVAGKKAGTAAPRGFALAARGVAMSMSNPLTILFFLAFLPNFTMESSRFSPAIQTFLLGTLFCSLVPFIYVPVIFAADILRTRLFASAKAMAALKYFSAAILAAVALVLACRIF